MKHIKDIISLRQMSLFEAREKGSSEWRRFGAAGERSDAYRVAKPKVVSYEYDEMYVPVRRLRARPAN